MKRKENLSRIFIIPALQIKESLRIDMANKPQLGFVNSYLFSDKYKYAGVIPVFLLFRPKEFNLEFYNFGLQLEKSQNYLETIDLPDGGVLFVFRIARRFEPDYRLFLRGKYSKFSNEYKACFVQKDYVRDEKGNYIKDGSGKYVTDYTNIYHIFNKTQKKRDEWSERLGTEVPENMELFDKCKIEDETLTL